MGSPQKRQTVTCFLSRVTQQHYSPYSAGSMTCPALDLNHPKPGSVLPQGLQAACSCALLTVSSPPTQWAQCDSSVPGLGFEWSPVSMGMAEATGEAGQCCRTASLQLGHSYAEEWSPLICTLANKFTCWLGSIAMDLSVITGHAWPRLPLMNQALTQQLVLASGWASDLLHHSELDWGFQSALLHADDTTVPWEPWKDLRIYAIMLLDTN